MADKAATTDAEQGGGDMHVPTMDEIKNFRCDCLISWMPLWELWVDTLEYSCAIPCAFVPNCCSAGDDDEKCDGSLNRCCFCLPCIDLRQGVQLWSFVALAFGIRCIDWGLLWLKGPAEWFVDAMIMFGFGACAIWLSFLLWMGAAFSDNDKLAITMNINGWLLIVGGGLGVWKFLNGANFFDILFDFLIPTAATYFFMACHAVKLFRVIRDGGDQAEAWKADAATLAWHGFPCCGRTDSGAGESPEVEVQPAVNQA